MDGNYDTSSIHATIESKSLQKGLRKIETHLDSSGKNIFFPLIFFKGLSRSPALRAFYFFALQIETYEEESSRKHRDTPGIEEHRCQTVMVHEEIFTLGITIGRHRKENDESDEHNE